MPENRIYQHHVMKKIFGLDKIFDILYKLMGFYNNQVEGETSSIKVFRLCNLRFTESVMVLNLGSTHSQAIILTPVRVA